MVKEADSADKELEPAVAKAREGRVDEALGLIKEKAAKHPEWPPEQVILRGYCLASIRVSPAAEPSSKPPPKPVIIPTSI